MCSINIFSNVESQSQMALAQIVAIGYKQNYTNKNVFLDMCTKSIFFRHCWTGEVLKLLCTWLLRSMPSILYQPIPSSYYKTVPLAFAEVCDLQVPLNVFLQVQFVSIIKSRASGLQNLTYSWEMSP